MENGKGSRCIRGCLLIYTLLFWLSGFALLFLGIWMLVDPQRNYVLDLVNFSEDDPLLRFAAYTALCAGALTLVVGFLACCGAIKRVRCMLGSFIIFLFVLFAAELGIGILAVVYRDKFTGDRMPLYLWNMSHNRYHRDRWVTPLLDTIQYYIRTDSEIEPKLRIIMLKEYGVHLSRESNQQITAFFDKLQFYEQCCGVVNSSEWAQSSWGNGRGVGRVPLTCCTQIHGANPVQPIARSQSRCQLPNAGPLWRYEAQQCCGGHGPYDYYDSFWFITNTERGTRSFVPKSCCKQTQSARAWAIQPVDAMCTTYHYYTQAFNNSVHIQGCGKRMQEWYNTQAIIFAAVGFSFSILQLLGIVLAAIVCCQIQDKYSYIET